MTNQAQTLKSIAAFLDPHLLLFTLQKTTTEKQTGSLQSQIKSRLLISKKDAAKTLEEQSKAEAKKILDILNGPEHKKLREEHKFTLEYLKKEKDITGSDCQKLQQYSKVLFESGRYQEAEKILFSLKEILVNEQSKHSDLML